MSRDVDPVSVLATLDAVDVAAADGGVCAALLGSVRQVRGWLDAYEASVTSRLRELHAAGGAPAAAEHARHGGVSAAEGRRRERRSKALDDAPSFGDALASGSIGAEHVDALANATVSLPDEVKALVLDHEAALLADAARQTPEQFGRTCRDLAQLVAGDNGLSRNERQRGETYLSRRVNRRTGMTEGTFSFHPELAARIFEPVDREVAALIAEGERCGDPDCVDRTVNRNRLTAEALGRLIGHAHRAVRPGEADITVIVDADTLIDGAYHPGSVCETSSGSVLPPETVRRLCCQGRIIPIVVDQHGNPFQMGRQIRTANRDQRRALRAIYRTCAFDGCDIDIDRCEMHHVTFWEHGGTTDLANLVPICAHHHHLVHEAGWTLHLAPDRTLTITRPHGTVWATTTPDIPAETRTRNRGRPPNHVA
jgi:hypothetical protein